MNPESFVVHPKRDNVPAEKVDQVMTQARRLEEVLQFLYPMPCESRSRKPGQVSGATIVDQLVCCRQSRIGPEPCGTAREILEDSACRTIEQRKPLALVGIYGTPRHIENTWLNRANLSDVAALMMIQAAMERVSSVYPEGAFYRSLDEDLTALWLDINQQPNGDQRRLEFQQVYQQYFEERKRIIELLSRCGLVSHGQTAIHLLQESSVFHQIWEENRLSGESSQDFFLSECEQVRPVFIDFLRASTDIIVRYYSENDERWDETICSTDAQQCKSEIEALPEFAALEAIGWKGSIPPEMRMYYLRKFREVIGDINLKPTDELLLYHVATYLSSTLVRNRHQTLTHSLQPETPVIKMPLVKPVSGRPLSHLALVPQRTLPYINSGRGKKLVSHNNASPWSCIAGIGGKKLRVVRVCDLSPEDLDRIVPAQVFVRGPDNGPLYLAETALMM